MIQIEIEHNRKRLNYFTQQKARLKGAGADAMDKWISIYQDRLKKLERQLSRVSAGLRTEAPKSRVSSSDARNSRLQRA